MINRRLDGGPGGTRTHDQRIMSSFRHALHKRLPRASGAKAVDKCIGMSKKCPPVLLAD